MIEGAVEPTIQGRHCSVKSFPATHRFGAPFCSPGTVSVVDRFLILSKLSRRRRLDSSVRLRDPFVTSGGKRGVHCRPGCGTRSRLTAVPRMTPSMRSLIRFTSVTALEPTCAWLASASPISRPQRSRHHTDLRQGPPTAAAFRRKQPDAGRRRRARAKVDDN